MSANLPLNNKQHFTILYKDLYEKGETGLGRMSSLRLRDLDKTINEISKSVKSGSNDFKLDETYIFLWETKLICEVVIAAENKYYETSFFGMIKKATQSFWKCICPFKYETSLDKGNRLLEEVKNKLKEYGGEHENDDSVAEYQAYKFMARHCATLKGEDVEYRIDDLKYRVTSNGRLSARAENGDSYIQSPNRAMYRFNSNQSAGSGGEKIVYRAKKIVQNSSEKEVVALAISNNNPKVIASTQRSISILDELKSDYAIKVLDNFTMRIGSYNYDSAANPIEKKATRTFEFNENQAVYVVTKLYPESDLEKIRNIEKLKPKSVSSNLFSIDDYS